MLKSSKMRKLINLLVLVIGVLATSCQSGGDTQGAFGCLSFTQTTTGKEMAPNESTNDWSSIAQSFTATSDLTISSVSVLIAKQGTLADLTTTTVAIHADNSGEPAAAATASGSKTASSLSTTSGFVSYTLSSNVSLSSGTTYWIVMSAGYVPSDTNNVKWSAYDESTGGYTGGQAKYKDGSNNWVSLNVGEFRDLAFVIPCS